MKNISVIYYTGYGHTEVIAKSIIEGIQGDDINSHLIKVNKQGEITNDEWEMLHNSHAIIFGAPTYMGSIAGSFKIFMDSTSKIWSENKWYNKIAGGFTNSGSLSGDKLSSLIQLNIFAAQHSMIWVSQGLFSNGKEDKDINRIGSYLGVMAQSDNLSPEQTPPTGDRETARLYGKRIAEIVSKFN